VPAPLPVPDRRHLLLFLCGSLALHAALYLWMRAAWTLPDAGFELTLPDTIELGVIEGTTLESPPAASPASPPAPPAPAAAPAKPNDGSAEKPAPPKPPKPPKPSGPDAATRQSVAKNGIAALSPPGAQLALRVDLDAIRASPLSEDVRDLLDGIPDVGAILEGSEIEPVRDLSRLFLASPNLQRSRVVLAGKYRGDEAVPRSAAEKLASARGKTLEWQTHGTIPVAPWENPDSTERVLALFGSGLFAITRADDLPRVLGIGQALAQRRKNTRPNQPAAEALLEMGQGQLVTLTVENAKLFARGATANVPDRLVIVAHALQGETLQLTSEAEFPVEADAERALKFWDEMRTRYARSPLVALLGVSGLLEQTTLHLEGKVLELRSTLRLEEARLILRFVRDSLAPRRARTIAPADGTRAPAAAPPEEDPAAPQ
jgi:hypothetical protein